MGFDSRYRCPECGSSSLRDRHTERNFPKVYPEYRELPYFEVKETQLHDVVARYRCKRCKTRIEADERVDTKGSGRCSSFYYDGETV